MGILKSIEGNRGPTDPALIRASDDWASDVLGWKGYAPWLYVYAAVAGEFKEGWIPDNYYRRVVVPAVDMPFGAVSDMKTLSHKLFDHHLLPDLLYLVRGVFYVRQGASYRRIAPKLVPHLLFERSDRVVLKADGSSLGRGIAVFDAASFDVAAAVSFGSGVFQSYVDQSEAFDAMSPGSVATLRMTTVVEPDGKISLRAAYLRVGRAVDTHVQSASNVRVPVDLDDGMYGSMGYLPSWVTIDRHPDSGFVFAGQGVPGFDACKSTVLSLHERLPHVTCIGWDLAVGKADEPVLLEWNGTFNDIKFSEAVQGPCFVGLGWENLWRSA